MNRDSNTLQNVTTLLAYALPLLQFFFALLPTGIISFFAFHDYFLIVSIFTAVISYILILVFKSNPYFSWYPLQKKRKYDIEKWRIYTDKSLHTSQDIRRYQKENTFPKELREINNDNIVIKLLIPIIAISFTVFCAIGAVFMVYEDYFASHNQLSISLQLIQALAYSSFLVSSVLAFANQFLRESGIARYRKDNSEKYNKAISLVRDRNGFDEYKSIKLISQFQRTDPKNVPYSIFFLGVNKEYYVIVTDIDVDMVYNIHRFKTRQDAESFIS